MGLHRAKTSINAPAEQIWQTVTSSEFSVWPGGVEVVFEPAGRPAVGTEVLTRISIPGISGVVVSRVVECDPPHRLATQLVSTQHLPVAPDTAYSVIDGKEELGLTTVSVEIDLRFSGLKKIVGKALDLIISQELQPGLDQMKANFEKSHGLPGGVEYR